MSGGGSKISIPSNVRKTIQHIKEITGSHSEEEIYAMLKECSMDPNETAQKLLFQDTFHEVKRKRDRRKENSNRESTESRWQSGSQGRGSKGGRSNYLPRHVSNDAGDGRNGGAGRENGINPAAEKGTGSALPTSHGTKNKETISAASSVSFLTNHPNAGSTGNASVTDTIPSSAGNHGSHSEVISSFDHGISKLDSGLAPFDINGSSKTAVGVGDSQMPAGTQISSSVCISSFDPVIIPSNDSRPSSVGTIKREVGSHRPPVEPETLSKSRVAAASDVGGSIENEKVSGKFQETAWGAETSQHSFISTHSASSVTRPSSNYNNRSQQLVGSQKAGSNKEWKPKPTNPNFYQRSESVPSEVDPITTSQSASSVPHTEEAASKLQKKLESLHLPQRQPVILPNHIHVPESERTKFSFGSFGAGFGIVTNSLSGPESDKSSTIVSEMSQAVEETIEQSSSDQIAVAAADEENYTDHPESPKQELESVSPGDDDVSSHAVPDDKEFKQEGAAHSGGQQYSVVHTTPSYNYGFVPQIIGSQIPTFENSESQVRDVSRPPSFVVQQPFDPTSYYAQFYRSGVDSDGRLSPFSSPGIAAKYNDSVGVLQHQTSQPSQEAGNTLVLSTAGPTPLVTQAAGLMQSSIAMTQQPLPVFRTPTGVHMSPYPPNYIPYGHYFPPFYVPPPTIPQFLANGAFPQQPQGASLFPAPPSAATPGVKYSLPQYKTATNAGNSTHVGVPISYGPYGSSPAGYSSNSAATAGNATTNEDLGASQFKENMYITGQQSDGSRVWIPAPGRDIPSLPTSSFYNLPQQGQHVTFPPTQAWQFCQYLLPSTSNESSNRVPTSTAVQDLSGAIDVAGPTANVYQQPQHAPLWPGGNY